MTWDYCVHEDSCCTWGKTLWSMSLPNDADEEERKAAEKAMLEELSRYENAIGRIANPIGRVAEILSWEASYLLRTKFSTLAIFCEGGYTEFGKIENLEFGKIDLAKLKWNGNEGYSADLTIPSRCGGRSILVTVRARKDEWDCLKEMRPNSPEIVDWLRSHINGRIMEAARCPARSSLSKERTDHRHLYT